MSDENTQMTAPKKTIVFRIVLAVLGLWVVLAVLAWQLTHVRDPSLPDLATVQQDVSTGQPSARKVPPAAKSRHTATEPQTLVAAIPRRAYAQIVRLVQVPELLVQSNSKGHTPLHLAVLTEDSLLVRLLLAHGADTERQNHEGLVPLELNRIRHRVSYGLTAPQRVIQADFERQSELIETEIAAEQVQARFLMAARSGDFAQARLELAAGADATATHSPAQLTLLHMNKNSNRVAEHLALGVPLNALDKLGNSALSLAVGDANYRLVQALLDQGAVIKVADKSSDLLRVVRLRSSSATTTVRTLLDAGAPLRQIEWLAALGSRNHQTVKVLMKQTGGFDPQSADGKERLEKIQKHGSEGITKAVASDPRIAQRLSERAGDRERAQRDGIRSLALYLLPYFLVLLGLTYLFTLISSGFFGLFITAPRLLRWTVALSTVALVELFVFTVTVRSQLSEFRLYGELKPNFRFFVYLVIGAMALALSFGAQSKLKFLSDRLFGGVHRLPSMIYAPAAVGLYALLVVGLFQHNSGALAWPSQVLGEMVGNSDGRSAADKRQFAKEQHKLRKRQAMLERRRLQQQPHYILSTAVYKNDVEGLRKLLASGTAPDLVDADGLTALHALMYKPKGPLLPILLDAGADINKPDNAGSRPIHKLLGSAAEPAAVPMLGQLIAAGVDVNTANGEGMTPLCLAQQIRRPQVRQQAVELLLAADASTALGTSQSGNCATVADSSN